MRLTGECEKDEDGSDDERDGREKERKKEEAGRRQSSKERCVCTSIYRYVRVLYVYVIVLSSQKILCAPTIISHHPTSYLLLLVRLADVT
jgi:hypothetical protein